MIIRMRRPIILVALILASASARADDVASFRFEAVPSLDDMSALIRQRFALGAARDDLRRTFVAQGHATLKVNPSDANVEKYLYDIDLCGYYVWRWNISADFDAGGRLQQGYVNGEPVFASGSPKLAPPKGPDGHKQAIVKQQRPRPEAFKGESSLGYVLYDPDVESKAPHPRFLLGAGPSKPDPVDMGRLITYSSVDPWRSIFDDDPADRIVGYAGDCTAVDAKMKSARPASKG
jgi:hypothetical protein